MKGIHIGKEKVKLPLLMDDMLLKLINQFSNIVDYKINIQKSILFPYGINDQSDIKIKMFKIATKNKIN